MKNHSKDEPYIENGKRIRSERKAAGFTNAESFGLRLNIGRSQVEQIEQGKRLPALDTLVKMAEIFNCEVGYLLCEPGYECRTRTKTDIQRETGLSEKAIEVLRATNKEFPDNLKTLSRMIESSSFSDLLDSLRHYAMIGYAAHTSIPEKISQYRREDQSWAMERIQEQQDSISEIEVRFLALKSNLDLKDISALFLNEARDNISAIAKEISEPIK